LAATQWNKTGQLGLVVGATFPEEIAKVRSIVGEMPLLIPGIGAQGGDIPATVQAGKVANSPGTGMIINSSRAILYASKDTQFADAARKAAIATRDALRLAKS
jgi:orotidine-5'-phosphate decarboxylase